MERNILLHRTSRYLARCLTNYTKQEIKGIDNIPKDGPVILISNHVNWADPIIIGGCVRRDLYALAKLELFSNPLSNLFVQKIGAQPYDRENPFNKVNVRSIGYLIDKLSQNEALLLFGEGTRSLDGTLGDIYPDPIKIAQRLEKKYDIKPKYVTCAITYESELGLFGRFYLQINEPSEFDSEYNVEHWQEKLKTEIGLSIKVLPQFLVSYFLHERVILRKEDLFEGIVLSTEKLKEAGANYDERLLDHEKAIEEVNKELDNLFQNSIIYSTRDNYVHVSNKEALETNHNRIMHLEDVLKQPTP